VVVAIISILAALLMPALKNARESAKSTACMNDLRQIGFAYRMYADDNNDYFPACDYWYNSLTNYVPTKVFFCPAGPPTQQWSLNRLSYSYNYASTAYLGIKPLSNIAQPAETVVCLDSDGDGSADYVCFGNGPLPSQEPGRRHHGGSNVLWVDIHISWHSYAEIQANNPAWFDNQ
jgi:type II secretory pathway pseudopilin PulG